jgi:hypothetical protein
MTGVIKIIEENIPEVRFMHFSFMWSSKKTFLR